MRYPAWSTALLALGLTVGAAAVPPPPLTERPYALALQSDGPVVMTAGEGGTWTFRPEFTVLLTPENPQLAMRPGVVPHVPYNVPTWVAREAGAPRLHAAKRSAAQAGDGFDDRILDARADARTADLFAAGDAAVVTATEWARTGDTIHYRFATTANFELSAELTLPAAGPPEPRLTFTLTPKVAGYFSAGYTGAPATAVTDAEEFWQPFIWQEKRFPNQPILTPAFECPVPATFVRRHGVTLGVVAESDEFSFSPLPLLDNSRFGVALRAADGAARPMVFAPVLGGAGSKRAPGEAFTFHLRLYAHRGDATTAFEDVARRLYDFHDYRSNATGPLNETLDRVIDYGMSHFSWFIDELKGCAYSTDVPGAVKNVSALNPLDLALVTDDESIFRQRAYPIVEYLLSREKFLFSLDAKQKIQSPSRALLGPCAPLSELTALYGITHGASPVFLHQAERLLRQTRTLNLDDAAPGDTWPNNLQLYRVTGEAHYLARARADADAYLADRMAQGAHDFSDPGLFFFTSFAPKWIDLIELYEATHEPRYLEAARLGARRYTMFTWMAPQIPTGDVIVNPGGQAPIYWYLQDKGHRPMAAPEAQVPAWTLSEIGLTPESSGTMSGHRAIFMANFAPWMLRLAALTGDSLLHDVARSAVVGRYRNFPGYHINTARTNIYERADYPLHAHQDLSVNSFHYNHIWPFASILLDYLVTDAFARSHGAIDFPSRFIEGYAYLQSKFYGDRPGRFYGYDDAILWMPRHLLTIDSPQLNYVAARGHGRLYLAFANQSKDAVATEVRIAPTVLPAVRGAEFTAQVIVDGQPARTITMRDGVLPVAVAPMGQTAVVVEGIEVKSRFQARLLAATAADAWRTDYAELPWGGARAMILNFGPTEKTAYVYLQADDAQFKSVTLTYSTGGTPTTVTDAAYPFEFTVPLPADATQIRLRLAGTTIDGHSTVAEEAVLQR